MVRLIKTLQQALKMDREKFKVPRSVQQAIPIQRIWPDGVFQSGTKFSKSFRFSDINYAIARALASDPKILLCDEATSALDPQTTSSILELLKKINRQFGITIVIITHQMSVVREICTHVAIMYEGEVVEKGLVADIFANPQSEVAKELIRKDTGSDIDADSRLDAGREKGQAEIKSGEKIRIVFSENSAFEPVIANLILTFGEPVNILKADTKNVGGVAKGEMILEFMEGSTRTEMMKQYLKEKGLAIGEVTGYVGS